MTVVEPVDVDALVRSLRAVDFALRVEDPAFVATTRVLPFIHRASRVHVDLVLGASGLEEMAYERAIKRRIGGADVPVAAATDLVIDPTHATGCDRSRRRVLTTWTNFARSAPRRRRAATPVPHRRVRGRAREQGEKPKRQGAPPVGRALARTCCSSSTRRTRSTRRRSC